MSSSCGIVPIPLVFIAILMFQNRPVDYGVVSNNHDFISIIVLELVHTALDPIHFCIIYVPTTTLTVTVTLKTYFFQTSFLLSFLLVLVEDFMMFLSVRSVISSGLSILAVVKKRHRGTVSFVGYSNGGRSCDHRSFSSSKSPPPTQPLGVERTEEKKIRKGSSGVDRLVDNRKRQSEAERLLLDPPIPVQRFKNSKRKEWNNSSNNSNNNNNNRSQQKQTTSIFQTTQYSCRRRRQQYRRTPGLAPDTRHLVPSTLKSMDASALLNPRQFCAASAKSTHTHNVSRSINGTDAARRLLRGKKECLLAARKMINSSPLMLKGHNVPNVLIQHFVNMGDQLLKHYGPDAVECSFHNYYQEGTSSNTNRTATNDNSGSGSNSNTVTLPLHVRVRQKDATNSCLPPPAAYDTRIYDNSYVDWDHHLELYLTVMQNFANPLGKIFDHHHYNDKSNNNSHHPTKESDNSAFHNKAIDKYDFENDDHYDFTASPLLFDSLPPRWNVDILKEEYYDLQYAQSIVNKDNDDEDDDDDNTDTIIGTVIDRRRKDHDDKNNSKSTTMVTDELMDVQPIPPFPIVEFLQESSKGSGHVVIRLQGLPTASQYFGTDPPKNKRQPVTLVFDAGYYKNSSMAFREQ
jgi:hypothetical protein